MTKTIIGILGLIWSAPYTIPTMLVTLLLVLLGQLEYRARTDYLMTVWGPKEGSWMMRHFKDGGWRGFGFGAGMFTTLRPSHIRWSEVIDHEETHCFQQYALGPLFWISYILIMLVIFCFIPGKHPYHDHPFERHARRRAGQPITIPRERWHNGPFDRWPWW